MLVPLAWAVLILIGFWALAFVLGRRTRMARLKELRAEWGHAPPRDRDMTAIAAYYHALGVGTADGTLDDRTWADLNMNEVFSVLDRTESVVGQQVLYARLRGAPMHGHRGAFHALVTRASEDVPARERAQLVLSRLRAPAAYDLWWIAQPNVLEAADWHRLFPIAGLGMVALVVLAPFWPPAILLLIIGAVASLVARAFVARSLRVVAGAFRQVSPLVGAAEALNAFASDASSPLTGTLRDDSRRLSRLRTIASWAGRESGGAVAGDLPALLFEYLNLFFWLDANALFFGARELRARGPELLRVIAAVGEIDAALSVASYRAGTPGWTRPILTPAGPVIMSDVRHPLLPEAVPNSIALAPPHGAIITGSNMSGKSTFLRTLGVTTVLAQAIDTCLASRYQAPLFVVRSCIGLADDPATGKSYYLVEVESILAIVHAARRREPHLMLFDELFRGTNAVERIAAAEAVLVALLTTTDATPTAHVVVAATHDQELVDLLQGVYASHHFTDTIDDEGLAFDYKLRPGPATTRNAIALLEQRGAPPELVSRALARARTLDRAREPASVGEGPAPHPTSSPAFRRR